MHAFENACPHAGNPLIDGDVRGETLRCAYHLWEFDLKTGACLFGDEPAQTFAATVERGEIVIDLQPRARG